MANCKQCGTFQPRLNKGGICDGCKNNLNVSSGQSDGMNAYYDANLYNSGNLGNSQPGFGASRMLAPRSAPGQNVARGFPSPPSSIFQQSQNQQLQQQNNNWIGMSAPISAAPINQNAAPTLQTAITPDSLPTLLDKPITELTVADIIQINLISNDPIRQQISAMDKDYKKKFQTMDDRINILDKEKSKLEEENTVLRNVVTNMQRCLNRLDSDVRNKNVIITGLPEGEIQLDENGETYTTDKEKIKWLMQRMENNDFDDEIEHFNVCRIGEAKDGSNRVVKIVMESVEKRDKFLKNTSKMKDAPEPWNKVFIKKDQHPVYIAENNRIRKKAYELKKKQGYENKEVKVFNGKVLVDNVVVDKNLFFH